MEITFLTLNIWQGGMLFDNVLNFILKQDPDIVCLQEVQNEGEGAGKQYHTYDIFKKMLPQKHSTFSPTFTYRYQDIPVKLGNAIFSKFPFINTETLFYDIPPTDRVFGETHTDFSKLPRNMVHVRVDTGNVPVDVFTTHGSWGLNGEDNERRLYMSNVLVQNITNKPYVILSGDFNTFPHTKTMQSIEKHLVNIFKNQLHTTFNMKQKTGGNFATSVVDYIFVSPDIRVHDRSVPQVNISDHLPLLCSFTV